jgi:transcriptional regulator with XRE-family HTH domain
MRLDLLQKDRFIRRWSRSELAEAAGVTNSAISEAA